GARRAAAAGRSRAARAPARGAPASRARGPPRPRRQQPHPPRGAQPARRPGAAGRGSPMTRRLAALLLLLAVAACRTERRSPAPGTEPPRDQPPVALDPVPPVEYPP